MNQFLVAVVSPDQFVDRAAFKDLLELVDALRQSDVDAVAMGCYRRFNRSKTGWISPKEIKQLFSAAGWEEECPATSNMNDDEFAEFILAHVGLLTKENLDTLEQRFRALNPAKGEVRL